MDAIALGAVTAVWHRDVDEADRWFELVGRVHDAMAQQAVDEGTEVGWEEFKGELARQASSESFHADVATGLTDYVGQWSQAPLDVIAQLADPNAKAAIREAYSAAVAAYAQPDGGAHEDHSAAAVGGSAAVHAVAPEEPAAKVDQAAKVDEAALNGYLKQWSGQWDGAEQTWANFADRVAWYAPDELKAAVGEFVRQVGSRSDKAAALAGKGITVGGVPAATDQPTVEPVKPEPAVTDVKPNGEAEVKPTGGAEVKPTGGAEVEPTGGAEVKPTGEADGSGSPDAAAELAFDPGDLVSELIDEGQLAEAVDAGLIRFDPIDEDELELETA